MKKHTHRLLVLVFLFIGLCGVAQSDAEKTLLKSASKQFESKEFLKALPSFSQLLSISPDNKDYNFKYGVCLLASDEDVDKSLKHLKFVCADGKFEDKRAYYYLGKAYHLNYQFADALRSYREFKEKVDSKTANDFREVDRLITMADNGKELMSDIKDIKVIDKTESTAGDFFRNYDLSEMGGSVIKVPEELLSSVDKKKGHSPIMFFPDGGGEIIFSSYGGESHLELYSVMQKGDGGFTKPQKLPGVVNSPFDEDYPFLHSDGRTLYFSSKGHNSMGGYDVFKSKRDLSSGVFETPVNLDFAISSPDDDIFYIVDRDKRIANFASDRSSETGRLHVYKVAVSSAALEMAIIQGKLVNNTGGNAIAQIKVLDANTDEEIGVYYTDEAGNYLIDLPGTGKYKFFVEAEESMVLHTGLVDVPSFGKIKAFKQDMILSTEGSQEKLVITNQFDKEADLDILALIQDVVKQRAELEINFTGEPEAEVEEVVEVVPLTESEIVSRAGYGEDITIGSVVEKADQQSEVIASRIEVESVERDKAYARAVEWTERSETLIQKAEELYEQSQSASSSDEKEQLLLLTTVKRAEAQHATTEAAIALVLAEEISSVIDDKTVVLADLNIRNESISAAIQDKDQASLITRLEEVKEFEDKAIVQADALDAINQRSIESNRNARKVVGRVEEIRASKKTASISIITKETQLERAKKQKEKDILTAELSSLRAEVEDIDLQLELASVRLLTAQNEADHSEGAVTLLEQMRVGQMEDLMALRPISLPEGGLEDAERRIGNVRAKGGQIEVSKEELGRIMISRPELLSSLSRSEQQLLSEFTDTAFTIDESSSNANETVSALPENDLLEDELPGPEAEVTSLEKESEGEKEDLPRFESDEPEFQEGTSPDVTDDVLSTSEPELTDYSELTSTEVLSSVQSDYQSALDDIEGSDMIEIEMARATIDLNRAVVQVIDQKIIDLKYSSDYTDNEIKQGNVKALETVINGLEADMLIIAAQTETPLYPVYTEDLSTEELVDNSSDNTTEETQGTISETLAETPADTTLDEDSTVADIVEEDGIDAVDPLNQLDRIEELENLEAEINTINNDTDKSRLVKAASRIKSRAAFVRSIRNGVSLKAPLDESEKIALSDLIAEQQDEIKTDVQLWQVETGVKLSPAEIVLAQNNDSYIARRTILETSDDQEGVKELNLSSYNQVIGEVESLADRGLETLAPVELSSLDEFADSSNKPKPNKSYVLVYSELAPIAENEGWIDGLISDRVTRQNIKIIREEMTLLPVYGSSDDDKVNRHIELNKDLAVALRDEMNWKESELAFAAERNPFPAEVGELMAEANLLRNRADDLRTMTPVNTGQSRSAEMFTFATLLDLEALDMLEQAKQLEKHMSKGKEASKFQYKEAIVIDSEPLMQETASISEDSSSTEEELSQEIDVDAEGSSNAIESETSDLVSNEEANSETASSLEQDESEVATDSTEERPIADDTENEESVVTAEDYATRYDYESIDASEAIRNHPSITSELSEQDILPILSFDEEMSLMPDQELDSDYVGDVDLSTATTQQISLLETKGLEMAKLDRYQLELDERITHYDGERKKRTVRLAQVVDQMNTSGATDELKVEAERLATEIQVINAYTDSAEENRSATEQSLSSLKSEQEVIVQEIKDTTTQEVVVETIADDVEIIPVTEPEVILEDEEVINIPDPIVEVEEVVSEVAPDFDDFVVPTVLSSDLFRMSSANAERKRSIPVNIEMPAGTVYQVQVGAFRNPIPEAHFSEFDPIMATLLDNGITRYKVGLFKDELSAINARDQIRGIGYRDAFVVKYIDGDRDGIVRSEDIAGVEGNSEGTNTGNDGTTGSDSESQSDSNDGVAVNPQTQNQESTTGQASTSENEARTSRPLSSYDSDNSAYYEEAINAAPATQVERIEGLFYTVQVGVYSKPVTLASIFGISPLNSDLTPSGYIRYTSGIFDDAAIADQWKQKIQQRGVSDAFVTAYYNGNRITMDRAAQILSTQGEDVLVEIQELNHLDSDRQGQAIWEMVSTSDLFSDEVADEIDFKIRMGPYYERIPDKDVKVILDFEDNVDYGQVNEGGIIYTTKGRMNYDQAQEWRERFLELGISNANIVALKNGVEVPVKQALDFLLK